MQRLFVTTLSLMLIVAPAVTSAKNKIRVCHEGKTILIDVADAREHRRHGDTPGPCPSEAGVKADVEPDTETAPKPESTAEAVDPVDFTQEPEMKLRPERKQSGTFRPDPGFLPGTDDKGFDHSLMQMNKKAGNGLDKYIADLSAAFNIPQEKISRMLNKERIQPADVFMILQTAKLSGQPYRELVPQFKKHRKKGWGTVIRSLGIQPGSGMLKQDIPQVMQHYTEWEHETVSQPTQPRPRIQQQVEFQLDRDFRPHTGDREFDELLTELNRTGSRNIDQYIADLSYAFNIHEKKVNALIYRKGIQPADVFMILQTARLSGQPYKQLVQRFKKHRREGWGAVVTSLGIKPRSKMFLLLKEDIPQGIRRYVARWDGEAKRERRSKKKKRGSKGRRESRVW